MIRPYNKFNWILFSLLTAFFIIYFLSGRNAIPNWDEEASIDIALGIRPSVELNNLGLPIPKPRYEEIVSDTVFTTLNYERLNTMPNVLRSVMADTSNSFPYYALLHWLILVSGVELDTMRMFTILLAILNLILIFRLSSSISKNKTITPVIAVLLVGINPIYFSDAFLIRSYMLALSLCLLSTTLILNMIRNNQFQLWRFVLLGILSALAILTHYFTFAVIAASFIFFLKPFKEAQPGSRKHIAMKVFLSLALMTSVLLIWYNLSGPTGIKNLGLHNKAWAASSIGTGYDTSILSFGKQLLNFVAFSIGFGNTEGTLFKLIKHFITLSFLLSMLIISIKFWNQNKQRLNIWYLYLVIIALTISSIQGFKAGHFINFENKYLVFTLPYFMIAVTSQLDDLWLGQFKFTGIAIAALITLISLTFSVQKFQEVLANPTPSFKNSDSKPTPEINIPHNALAFSRFSRSIVSKLQPGDTIIFTDRETAHLMNYFMRGLKPFPQKLQSNPGDSNRIVLKYPTHESVFYVR